MEDMGAVVAAIEMTLLAFIGHSVSSLGGVSGLTKLETAGVLATLIVEFLWFDTSSLWTSSSSIQHLKFLHSWHHICPPIRLSSTGSQFSSFFFLSCDTLIIFSFPNHCTSYTSVDPVLAVSLSRHLGESLT